MCLYHTSNKPVVVPLQRRVIYCLHKTGDVLKYSTSPLLHNQSSFGDVGSGTVDGEYMSQAYIRLIVDGNQETFYVPSTQTFVNGEEPFNDPN